MKRGHLLNLCSYSAYTFRFLPFLIYTHLKNHKYVVGCMDLNEAIYLPFGDINIHDQSWTCGHQAACSTWVIL